MGGHPMNTLNITDMSPEVRAILDQLNLDRHLRRATLTTNRWGGFDADLRNGFTIRVAEDDTDINLYVFGGGQAMLTVSEIRLSYTPTTLTTAIIAATLKEFRA